MAKEIAMIDDDLDDRELFAEAVNSIDETIVCNAFESGRKLFAFLNKSKVDICLIVVDLNMPQMDGWEVLRRLKAMPRFQDTPVVICSTTARTDDKDHGLREHAIAVITKPDSYEEWKTEIRKMLDLCGLSN